MRLFFIGSVTAFALLAVFCATAQAAAPDDVSSVSVPNGCSKDQPAFTLRNSTKDRPIRATVRITTTRPSGKSERTQVVDINPGEIKSVGCASTIADTMLGYEIAGAFYLDYLRPEDRKPQ
jgi:hypothetical protein